jgi:aminodeoxyfutalosine deaminase
MPIITAALIHDGFKFLEPNSAIVLNDDGVILDILENSLAAETLVYEGLLCPGFINAHCHLELSYLHNTIPQHTGLIPFIQHINALRNTFDELQIMAAIAKGEQQMIANGIVAVGDICNTAFTINQKQNSKIQYHNFIEVFGLNDTKADSIFKNGIELLQKFKAPKNITPHAPYSISNNLFQLLNNNTHQSLLTIHNQECVAENELIQNGDGAFLDFYNSFNIDVNLIEAKNKSSLQFIQEQFTNNQNFIFVHNTFTQMQDIIAMHLPKENRSWCLCPNANKYIENTLPSIIEYLISQNENICLGTDSLASNKQLCMVQEMNTIYQNNKNIMPETLLKWATANGAKALQMNGLGSFAKNTNPGIINIKNWINKNEIPLVPYINGLY